MALRIPKVPKELVFIEYFTTHKDYGRGVMLAQVGEKSFVNVAFTQLGTKIIRILDQNIYNEFKKDA